MNEDRPIVYSPVSRVQTYYLKKHDILKQVYEKLEKIYQELYNTFQFKEFHMGADEVYKAEAVIDKLPDMS